MCRSPCGPMSGAPGTSTIRRCTRVRTARWSIRRPRAPRNNAVPAASALSAGRPCGQPAVERFRGRMAEGNRALLAALAEHPDHVAVAVEVVDVETDQLTDPDPGGIEQLEHRHVAQSDRAAVVGELGRRPDQVASLVGTQHRRQRPVRPWRTQGGAGVSLRQPGPVQPGREHPGGRRPSGQRRARQTERLLLGQPAAQRAEVEVGHVGEPEPAGVVEQAGHVAEVGPHRVRGEVSLGDQVALVDAEHARECLGELVWGRLGRGGRLGRAGRGHTSRVGTT